MTTQRIAELEAEVLRLREALEHLSKAAGQTIDVRTPEDWVNLNIGLSLSIQALSTPFTPTVLPELIEKASEVMRKDAERYQWLKSQEPSKHDGYAIGYFDACGVDAWRMTTKDLDQAIDAAMIAGDKNVLD